MSPCCVETCNNYYGKTKGVRPVSYHKVPKNPDLAQKWIEAIKKPVRFLPAYPRVCSDHFSENCYQRDLKHELLALPPRKKLKSGAVPDINLPALPSPSDYCLTLKREKSEELETNNRLNFADQNKSDIANSDKEAFRKSDIDSGKTTIDSESFNANFNEDPVENSEKNEPNKRSPLIAIETSSNSIQTDALEEDKKSDTAETTSKVGKKRKASTRKSEPSKPSGNKRARSKTSPSNIENIPVRSSIRKAKRKSREALSESFVQKINSQKMGDGNNSRKEFNEKLTFLVTLELLFARNPGTGCNKEATKEAAVDKSEQSVQ